MTSLRSMLDYAYVLPRLGIGNVLAVMHYRRQWRDGTLARRLPERAIAEPKALWTGDGASSPALTTAPELLASIVAEGDTIVAGSFLRFGRERIQEGEFPAWHKAVYAKSATLHFSNVPLNAVPGEDVKLSWDLSRFHWAPKLALAAAASTGDARARYLARLDQLTMHWMRENGFERGVNWACAHEVSIRGIQLLLTNHLLETHLAMKPSAQLVELLSESWKRVEAVHAYGIAQQNNHGLTEHVFLIYGAAFLSRQAVAITSKERFATLQRQLPALIDDVILPDGGTAMYSLNYHRVFCDILAYAKLFDDAYGLQFFVQAKLQQKVAQLAAFLAAAIEPSSGALPWIGNHDGSLHSVQYSDIADAEPSLLLLSALFDLPVNERAKRALNHVWLFGYTPNFVPVAGHGEQWFDDFGLAIVDRPRYRAYVKYPRNQFRPAQEDFLHLDLWIDGVNVLSDSGKYSYNAPTASGDDGMNDAVAHNVPTLLDQPLLRKLSPFLYAYWPTTTVDRDDIHAPRLRVALPGGITLSRTLRFEEGRITLQDHVASDVIWGVVFHGQLGAAQNGATIAGKYPITFANLQEVSVTECEQADNYHSSIAKKQLIAIPMDKDLTLTTTISLSEI